MEKIQPFADDKRRVFAKLYINDSWFEELSLHLPNDLLFVLFQSGIDLNMESSELEHLIDLVEHRIPDIPFFPFELNFSLINEGVVELDSIFGESYEKNRNNAYKPYFYEFSGYCKSWGDLRKLLLYYIKSDYGYFTCFLDFSEEADYDRNDNIIAVVDGNILFSASPIEEKSGRLVVVHNSSKIDPKFMPVLDDSIYKCITNPINESRKTILKDAVDNLKMSFEPKNAIIYNVGQGNNVSIELNGGKHIFFDIGLTKSRLERNQSETKAAIKEFNKIKPEIVILSHWDMDHILGVAYANNSIYDAVWIVPDLWGLMKYTYKRKGVLKFKYVSDSAKRLLKYLDFKSDGKLFIIDESWTNDCIYSSKNEKMCIWTGSRQNANGINGAKEPYNINEANNFGLIMTFRNKKKLLLPGDCEYSIMPSDICKVGYEYLLASHHCSKMSKIPLAQSASNKKAILSYGVANTYGHPNKQHIRELSNIGYEINTTLGHRHIRCNLK
ncbi:MBL fold metallo-hydrolase [Clostridium pasteurianum]|uniref:Putative hydrolase (Metallo-beta-lactamase superfamily) n=1 Tax=Clostridium pasteurianum BC1 TaxID=86416 RepID=R4KBX8_CLOPA|nr:MBL fold metallo-hydrolase [Clostridium pasteurianum]AGK97130.1 putative hydrolase (metallo-beta-lactamase superfamily) [Clostridium pasteurianum BC1]